MAFGRGMKDGCREALEAELGLRPRLLLCHRYVLGSEAVAEHESQVHSRVFLSAGPSLPVVAHHHAVPSTMAGLVVVVVSKHLEGTLARRYAEHIAGDDSAAEHIGVVVFSIPPVLRPHRYDVAHGSPQDLG
jgi:hypothetical protein